ncbi:MAG TPA: HAD-IIIC family phosphatase [Rhodanobacteraceae bacterium]|nr:HAD-IIIC family phosphatase [Rhodanobacteraceae bacterium]
MTAEKPILTLSGTYTLDLLVDVVDFWADRLGLSLAVRVTPYGQMFQQLLDPTSALRRNAAGANVVALRFEDLVAAAPATLDARVGEVADALKGFRHEVPCLVLVGPSAAKNPAFERATQTLRDRLADVPNVFVEAGERATTLYRVGEIVDPVADRFGHVPYTPPAIAALGTVIARWYSALVRAPVKAFAVDGDNTLWSGVVAEDGVDAVRVDEPRARLQRALAAQSSGGRVLCLLSKNEEPDVRALFSRAERMPLAWSDFVARRIDWSPKSSNLKSIAAELDLGASGFVFLDDNPVECAEMRAHCPDVTTVRVPDDASKLATFIDHLWLFDQPRVTQEDLKRTQMYRDNALRAELRENAPTLEDFLKNLALVVDIGKVGDAEVPRVAQLTQRTNQFNASLIRCDEAEIRRNAGDPNALLRFVRARDRFGDYGIVGVIRAHRSDARLVVDLFMLSCRALGRGIEHRMIAAAGEHAVAQGLAEIELQFRQGDRNGPAKRFLESVLKPQPGTGNSRYRLSAATAASLVFDATDASAALDDAEDSTPVKPPTATDIDIGSRYEEIAHALTSGADIVRAIAHRMRARPDLGSGFVAPANGLERDIAAIWREVLRIEPIGAHDRFQDLGGKSIHLVRVHGLLLERLRVDVDITTLFQHTTVHLLARHLEDKPASAATAAAQARGAKMREARMKSQQRYGVAK